MLAGRTPEHYRTCYLNTPNPGMHAEPVLRAGEELKALKSFRCLNSTADAARSGSSPTERVQTSTHSPAARPEKAISRLHDRPSRRCSRSRSPAETEARRAAWT